MRRTPSRRLIKTCIVCLAAAARPETGRGMSRRRRVWNWPWRHVKSARPHLNAPGVYTGSCPRASLIDVAFCVGLCSLAIKPGPSPGRFIGEFASPQGRQRLPRSGILNAKSRKLLGFGTLSSATPGRGGFSPAIPAEMPPPPKTRRRRAPLQSTPP